MPITQQSGTRSSSIPWDTFALIVRAVPTTNGNQRTGKKKKNHRKVQQNLRTFVNLSATKSACVL